MDLVIAEATCVLKVDTKCHACKMMIIEILGSVCGIYDIDTNAEEGWTKIQAVVEPNVFMKAIARTGPHAETKWVKLQHPKMNRGYYFGSDMYNFRNGYNFGPGFDPFNHRWPLPDYPFPDMGHPYYRPFYGLNSSHYRGSNPFYHGSLGPPPLRRHGPFHF